MQENALVSLCAPCQIMYFFITTGIVTICLFGFYNVYRLEMFSFKFYLLLISVWPTLFHLCTCISYNSWYYSTFYLSVSPKRIIWDSCQVSVFVLFGTSQIELLVFGISVCVLYNHLYEAYLHQREDLKLRAFLYPSVVLFTACAISSYSHSLMTHPETSFCFKYLTRSPFLSAATSSPVGSAVFLIGEILFLSRVGIKLISDGFVSRDAVLDAGHTLYLLSHIVGIMISCLEELGSVDIQWYPIHFTFQWAVLALFCATTLIQVAMLATIRALREAQL